MQKITADAMPLYAVPEEDAKNFIKWVFALRDKNNFDMKVMTYPRTIMCRAQAGEETIMYLPLQPVLMYESLAPKPGLTERQTAMGLWRIGEVVERAMKDSGHCEAYFITSDEKEANVCAAHGWTICMHDPERKQWLMKRQIEPPKYPVAQESTLSEPKVESGVTPDGI